MVEREFLRLVHAAGLPRPHAQAHLSRRGDKLIRVDFHFENSPIVVETLGYRWHHTGAQMRADSERPNRLQLSGFIVLQFVYSRIVDDPVGVIAEVAEALARFMLLESA